MGRAARHVNGRVIMYADKTTDSMKRAIAEVERRRTKQIAYNTEHGIEPKSIVKAVHDLTERVKSVAETKPEYKVSTELPRDEAARMIKELEKQMKVAAQALEFEKAALVRDQIAELRKLLDDGRPEWERIRTEERQARVKPVA
jgi:excinuclease ABC subunit B